MADVDILFDRLRLSSLRDPNSTQHQIAIGDGNAGPTGWYGQPAYNVSLGSANMIPDPAWGGFRSTYNLISYASPGIEMAYDLDGTAWYASYDGAAGGYNTLTKVSERSDDTNPANSATILSFAGLTSVTTSEVMYLRTRAITSSTLRGSLDYLVAGVRVARPASGPWSVVGSNTFEAKIGIYNGVTDAVVGESPWVSLGTYLSTASSETLLSCSALTSAVPSTSVYVQITYRMTYVSSTYLSCYTHLSEPILAQNYTPDVPMYAPLAGKWAPDRFFAVSDGAVFGTRGSADMNNASSRFGIDSWGKMTWMDPTGSTGVGLRRLEDISSGRVLYLDGDTTAQIATRSHGTLDYGTAANASHSVLYGAFLIKDTYPLTGVVSSQRATTQAASLTIVADAPLTLGAGSANDNLIAVVLTTSRVTVTPPASWSLQASHNNGTQEVYVYGKLATGAEPATYTWTGSGSTDWAVGIIHHRPASSVGTAQNTVVYGSTKVENASYGLDTYNTATAASGAYQHSVTARQPVMGRNTVGFYHVNSLGLTYTGAWTGTLNSATVAGWTMGFGTDRVAPTNGSLHIAGGLIIDGYGQSSGGTLYTVQLATLNSTDPAIEITSHAKFGRDYVPYLKIVGNGDHYWGDGTNAHDVSLYRGSAGALVVADGGTTGGALFRVVPSTAQTLAAATTVLANANIIQINSVGNVTLTAAPTIANGNGGQRVTIINVDTADTITFQDQGTLASSNLRLTAATVALAPRQSMELMWNDTVGDWVQVGNAVAVL